MANLTFPSVVFLVWDLKRVIEQNLSIQKGMKLYLERHSHDEFAKKVFICTQSLLVQDREKHLMEMRPYQKAVLILYFEALKGVSIYDQLIQIERDLIEECECAIQAHIALLPIKLQIPLILFIFPAICILLIIPTLAQLNL